ncbi:MAG: DUF4013 domain-containing protein [Methanobacterium sp.]
MDIVENITSSLKYPLSDWTKILILMVISIIPIVNFMSAGYYLRIIKSTLAGINDVPDFDNLGELFIDGIKILILGIIYMIVPIIIFILAAVLAGPASVSYSSGYSYYVPFTAFTGLSLVLMVIGFLLAIIVSIIYLPALVNMALYDGELGAAFRFSEILDRIKVIGWGSYILWIIAIWITTIIVGLIIGIIGGILLIVLIGFIVIFAGEAYLIMFQSRSLALLFAESIE